jgi:outer membrane protein assembly factor BamB
VWAIGPDGKEKWRKPDVDFGSTSSIMLVSDSVYIVARVTFLALDTDGHRKWGFDLRPHFDPQATVGADGTVYVTGAYRNLYALDTQVPLAQAPWPKFRADVRNTGRVNTTVIPP